VRVGELFSIADGTIRAVLSGLVAAERVALRKGMIDLRLAELREGRLTIASQGRAPTAYSATQQPA
jgi:hypothetical protein